MVDNSSTIGNQSLFIRSSGGSFLPGVSSFATGPSHSLPVFPPTPTPTSTPTPYCLQPPPHVRPPPSVRRVCLSILFEYFPTFAFALFSHTPLPRDDGVLLLVLHGFTFCRKAFVFRLFACFICWLLLDEVASTRTAARELY